MIDWISFSISITALAISSATAIISLYISWRNYQKAFNPILIFQLTKKENSDIKRICIKNVGRGTAFSIEVWVYDVKKEKYHFYPINPIPPNEEWFLSGEIVKTSTKEITDLHKLDSDNITLLYHIKYENESSGKIETFYFVDLSIYFFKISKKEFKKSIQLN